MEKGDVSYYVLSSGTSGRKLVERTLDAVRLLHNSISN